MKLKAIALACLGTLSFFWGAAQQAVQQENATLIITGTYLGERPSLAEQMASGEFVPFEDINHEMNPKRSDANRSVPGKGMPIGPDPLVDRQVSHAATRMMTDPIITWECASSGATPTDPTGAVGPDHFMNAWNSSFKIWDKDGNGLVPAASLATIWPGQTAGDPIVMYDRYADRFFISQFSFSNSFLVAVSQGPDPVNDGWYTYEFPVSSFPDYPKFSVWSDGYYITANKDSFSAGSSEVVFVIERDKILVGDNSAQMVGFPLPGISTNGFYSPLGFNANGSIAPEPGNCPICYMQDDAWAGVSDDHLKIWTVNVNWDGPSTSTISSPEQLITEDFDGLFDGGAFDNLPQPSGPDIDCLQATIMYMAQFRRFSTYNACVLNWAVDLDGNDDLAGVRWLEIRQDAQGEPWSIYQEGTYTQPDGYSAFCASICMDYSGNIGLGYSVVSDTEPVGLRFTGRYAGDPLGTMTFEEGIIAPGVQNDPATRYGDYSQLTVDPLDDCTFWFVGEHFNGGTRKNTVGAFKLGSSLSFDVGVIAVVSPQSGSLTNSESITVTLRNYGLETVSNFPVSYQLDGGPVINETYLGAIDPGAVLDYTFMATADFGTVGQLYTLWTSTGLATDENPLNDAIQVEIMHLEALDVGVTAIITPVDGPLTDSEVVTVVIENFGAEDQSNFEVAYSLDGGAPVVEMVTDVVPSQGTLTFIFSTPAAFVDLGMYELTAYTQLFEDSDNSNDATTVILEKVICQPIGFCDLGDGFQSVILADINNNSGCAPDGYSDYTDMYTTLGAATTYDLIINTFYGTQYNSAWIDFNDDFVFSNDELIVDNYIIADGEGAGDFTETIPFPVPADPALGQHLLRLKSNWSAPVDDACSDIDYGETEDYTVELTATSVEETLFGDNNLVIANLGDNQFKASLQILDYQDYLLVTIHNISGQKIMENKVYAQGGKYIFEFNMSYAAAGNYLVRMGTREYGKIQKIVVR